MGRRISYFETLKLLERAHLGDVTREEGFENITNRHSDWDVCVEKREREK